MLSPKVKYGIKMYIPCLKKKPGSSSVVHISGPVWATDALSYNFARLQIVDRLDVNIPYSQTATPKHVGRNECLGLHLAPEPNILCVVSLKNERFM